MTYRLLENLLGRLLHSHAKKLPKCTRCKKGMQKEADPLLFLIPIFFDNEYVPSTAWYEENCSPIDGQWEIPTGQRACRFWTLTCPECGQRCILVEDFLRVRDTEVVEKRNLYGLDELDLMRMTGRRAPDAANRESGYRQGFVESD